MCVLLVHIEYIDKKFIKKKDEIRTSSFEPIIWFLMIISNRSNVHDDSEVVHILFQHKGVLQQLLDMQELDNRLFQHNKDRVVRRILEPVAHMPLELDVGQDLNLNKRKNDIPRLNRL